MISATLAKEPLMPRKTMSHETLRGSALHPGERRCIACGIRIGDTDTCRIHEESASDRMAVWTHIRCPSASFRGEHQRLLGAWREAQSALREAREIYSVLSEIAGPDESRWRNELTELGCLLKQSLVQQDRLIAASLVIGFRLWKKSLPPSWTSKVSVQVVSKALDRRR